jgi:hypothetical protein
VTNIFFYDRSGDYDPIDSPSAKIVMGQVVGGGTGAFNILHVAPPLG